MAWSRPRFQKSARWRYLAKPTLRKRSPSADNLRWRASQTRGPRHQARASCEQVDGPGQGFTGTDGRANLPSLLPLPCTVPRVPRKVHGSVSRGYPSLPSPYGQETLRRGCSRLEGKTFLAAAARHTQRSNNPHEFAAVRHGKKKKRRIDALRGSACTARTWHHLFSPHERGSSKSSDRHSTSKHCRLRVERVPSICPSLCNPALWLASHITLDRVHSHEVPS